MKKLFLLFPLLLTSCVQGQYVIIIPNHIAVDLEAVYDSFGLK